MKKPIRLGWMIRRRDGIQSADCNWLMVIGHRALSLTIFTAEAVLILSDVLNLQIQLSQAIINPPLDFVGFAADMLLRIERIERQWKLLNEKYPVKWKQLLEEYKERGLGWSVLKHYKSSIIPPGPREQGSKWDAPGHWWRLEWIAKIK